MSWSSATTTSLFTAGRGAVVQNIRNFAEDFANTNVVRLEQNYRSTANILNAANKVIENNDDRLGKTLWTDAAAGEPIHVFPCDYGEEEANYVVDHLQNWVREDSSRTYENVAVLYRSHFQSLAIEIALQAEGIAYTIRGGARFYDRAEVRDALAYMQLANNREADVAFNRVMNVRPRGIGNASQDRIRDFRRSTRLESVVCVGGRNQTTCVPWIDWSRD